MAEDAAAHPCTGARTSAWGWDPCLVSSCGDFPSPALPDILEAGASSLHGVEAEEMLPYTRRVWGQAHVRLPGPPGSPLLLSSGRALSARPRFLLHVSTHSASQRMLGEMTKWPVSLSSLQQCRKGEI